MAGISHRAVQGEQQISSLAAARIHINGIVQGVGFRPFVFNLAESMGLTGWVRNSSSGVDIEIEGRPEDLEFFYQRLTSQAPPLSRIDSITRDMIPVQRFEQMTIVHSAGSSNDFVPISPDVTVCQDCLTELFDPDDRRYRYPFINCTNCGPRFTIIKDIPYDRPFTTMAKFPLCDNCRTEYENPRDRRFHAQPVACPDCGPHVWLEFAGSTEVQAEHNPAIELALRMIRDGKILAIRGLGGFHLSCDATNPQAVDTLRQRKLRVDKPFAVMFSDLLAVQDHCHLSEVEEQLLSSIEHPIVILARRQGSSIADQVSPNQHTIGAMLPYTPLHTLLLERSAEHPTALVMTSGNLSDEPIATGIEQARSTLGSLADAFLFHNRDIETRCDDSVVRVVNSPESSRQYPFRRSRGYAPNPIRLPWVMPQILAVGPMLKNTFCLTKDSYAFISHHIGDLENFETLAAYEQGIAHFRRLFRIQPEIIAYDLHPDYLSTRYALDLAKDLRIPAFGIQHHHAHIAACMAEHNLPAETTVIGLSYDGTGYGPDNTIWGGEVLLASYRQFSRPFHLRPIPLPGGDAAAREPWRLAISWLLTSGIDPKSLPAPLEGIDPERIAQVEQQLKHGINSPLTTSMGRLFDAVASLVGIRQQVNYEAQAAIELEALADPDEEGEYPYLVTDNQINPAPTIAAIVEALASGSSPATIAARFHNTIARLSLQVCSTLHDRTGIQQVALSGGVWQNMLLLERAVRLLSDAGFEVLIHQQVPANDGGLSLGQAVIAYHTSQD
jgi:hydrogenase maturation protein HypF